jgi:hypothetical protein
VSQLQLKGSVRLKECRLRLVGPSDEIHSVQAIMSGASDLSTICCEQQTLWRLEANNYVHSLAASVGGSMKINSWRFKS